MSSCSPNLAPRYWAIPRRARLGEREAAELGIPVAEPAFAPIIEPLKKCATADDVKAGRALFHLDGKGKPLDVALPALATLRKDGNGKVARGIVVQAEIGNDGTITYGLLVKNGIRVIKAGEIEKIELFER